MAGGIAPSQVNVSAQEGPNKYGLALILMVSLFFMIGFITVLNDVLIPSLKGLFALEAWQAMLIQFCFFGAYFIWGIPAGKVIKRLGYKKSLICALSVIAVGLLLFVPAASVIQYGLFLFALFVIASGLALLQVAINPYIIALGPEKTGASRLNLGGALNSTATFIGPIIGGAFILQHFDRAEFADDASFEVAKAAAVQGPYIALAIVTLLIAALLYFMKLPSIHSQEDEKVEEGQGSAYDYLHLKLGAGAIFFYVGAEVAVGSILILYLLEDSMGGLEEKYASSLLAYYWGSAMIGRLVGSVICQKIEAQVLLKIVAITGLVLLGLSFTGAALNNWLSIPVMIMNVQDQFSIGFEPVTVPYAALFLILTGLCHSVMWPAIFPLGIAKLGRHTSQGSGLMVMMIVGGAIIPLMQGWMAGFDSIGYKYSFVIVAACYAYILYYAISGYKAGKIASLMEDNSLADGQTAAANVVGH